MPPTMNRAHRRKLLLLAFGLLASPGAAACTVTSSILAFGAINPLSGEERDSTASITVSCPAPTAYTISLNAGSGTYNQRTMLSGSNALDYNLYTDSQRTLIWGDGSGVTRTVSGSASSTGTTHTIYGSIPAQRQAVPGAYSDSVIITITF